MSLPTRILTLLALVLLTACDDPSGPEPVGAVRILAAGAAVQQQTLPVGGSVSLTAAVEGASGATLAGRPVSWRSTAPAVATVDSSGLVTGVAPGTALVVAAVEQAADTVRVEVFAPVAGALDCAPGQAPLELRVGEVRSYAAAQAGTLCLGGGAAGAEYAYLPFNATAAPQSLEVEVRAGGVTPTAGPPTPAALPLAAGAREPREDWALHHALREAERELLALARPAPGGISRSLAGRAAPPAVGDRIQLNGSIRSCTDPDMRTARVEAVSERAVVVADTLANTRSDQPFTPADYEGFARLFDELIWPVLTRAMGEPSDLDGNGRVILFYTPAVNDLSTPGSSTYTGGFFHPRDLRPTTGDGACAGSNAGEVLYLLVPDSALAASNAAFGRTRAAERSPGVVGHELQHVINASGRRQRGTGPEDTWLNEGLSHIAEELLFYAATGQGSERNLSLEEIRASEPVRLAYNRYQSSNLGRLLAYLRAADTESAIGRRGDDDLPTRGAAWAFLRYAADRAADGEPAKEPIWRALVQADTFGVENLRAALGTDPLPWLQDWTTAVYADDAGLEVTASHRQPSWNYRELFRQSSVGSFPLRTQAVGNGSAGEVKLRVPGGGAAYLRLGVAPGGRAGVRATSGGIAPPEQLRITILRTR